MEHQLVEYAQSKNVDLAILNDTQRAELKESMIADQYPGECNNYDLFFPYRSLSVDSSFSGLKQEPKFLYDSMSGASSPEKLAQSSVLVSGGYDPCQYKVI